MAINKEPSAAAKASPSWAICPNRFEEGPHRFVAGAEGKPYWCYYCGIEQSSDFDAGYRAGAAAKAQEQAAELDRLNGQLLNISRAVGEALNGAGYTNVSRSPVDVIAWQAAEIERLTRHIAVIDKYATHPSYCDCVAWPERGWGGPKQCNCGLAAARAALDNKP